MQCLNLGVGSRDTLQYALEQSNGDGLRASIEGVERFELRDVEVTRSREDVQAILSLAEAPLQESRILEVAVNEMASKSGGRTGGVESTDLTDGTCAM